MSKLFVYGCSFSMGFNDFQRKKYPIYSWPFLLSNHLKHPLVLRAWPGWGWNQINYQLDNDLLGRKDAYDGSNWFFEEKISKKDIIILSSSYLERIRFPQLQSDSDQLEVVARYGKEIDDMMTINLNSFKAKVNLLNEEGYITLGWVWNGFKELDHSDCKYLIPNPEGDYYFQPWMVKNVEYNLIPGDTHFNDEGHKFIAEYFFNYIRDGKTLDLWR